MTTKAIMIEANKDTISSNSLYKIESSFKGDTFLHDPYLFWLKKDKNNNYTSITSVEGCRDSFITHMLQKKVKKDINNHGLGMLWSMRLSGQLSLVIKNMKRSIKIINSIEKSLKWNMSTMEIIKGDKIEFGASKLKNSIMCVYSPSEKWFTSTHSISLFIAIARLANIGMYEGIISYNGFKKRNKMFFKHIRSTKYIGNTPKDSYIMNTALFWHIFLENIDELYTKEYQYYLNSGTARGGDGIYSLTINAFRYLWRKDGGKTVNNLHKEGITLFSDFGELKSLAAVLPKKTKAEADVLSKLSEKIEKMGNKK